MGLGEGRNSVSVAREGRGLSWGFWVGVEGAGGHFDAGSGCLASGVEVEGCLCRKERHELWEGIDSSYEDSTGRLSEEKSLPFGEG
jgi:hypothetical protein